VRGLVERAEAEWEVSLARGVVAWFGEYLTSGVTFRLLKRQNYGRMLLWGRKDRKSRELPMSSSPPWISK
jgi:hypothetical protein